MKNCRRLYPTINTLMAFESVAKHQSFTEGAKSLNLTQSAVSRQIAALEAQLNCQLFDRNSRNVSLTETGKAYATDIKQALKIIERSTQKVLHQDHQHHLNLGILPTFGTRWLMPRIPRFVEQHTNITISFTSHIGEINFTKANLDAAIIHGKPSSPDVDYTFLMHENLVPVAAKSLIPNPTEITTTALQDFPLLRMHSRPYAWAQWFDAQGFGLSAQTGAVFEHFSSLSQACIGGMGIALMPTFLIQQELKADELQIVGNNWQNEKAYYLALPNNFHQKTPAIIFRDWLLSDMALTGKLNIPLVGP
jgi:LysR family glycine cleavage system transcriptional activator